MRHKEVVTSMANGVLQEAREALGSKVGVCLVVFHYDDEGRQRTTFAGNIRTEELRAALRELEWKLDDDVGSDGFGGGGAGSGGPSA